MVKKFKWHIWAILFSVLLVGCSSTPPVKQADSDTAVSDVATSTEDQEGLSDTEEQEGFSNTEDLREEEAPQQPVVAEKPSVNMQSALLDLVNSSRTFSYQYSGWVGKETDTLSGSGKTVYSDPESTVINGRSVIKQMTSVEGVLTVDGNSKKVSSQTVSYHDPVTGATLISESPSSYVAYQPYKYPVKAFSGDSGKIALATIYKDRSMQDELGYEEISYQVSRVDSMMRVTLNTNRFTKDGVAIQVGTVVFAVDESGKLTPLSAQSVSSPGQSTSYQIFSAYANSALEATKKLQDNTAETPLLGGADTSLSNGEAEEAAASQDESLTNEVSVDTAQANDATQVGDDTGGVSESNDASLDEGLSDVGGGQSSNEVTSSDESDATSVEESDDTSVEESDDTLVDSLGD